MEKSIDLLACCLRKMIAHISATAQKIYCDDSIQFKNRIYKVSIITTDSGTGYLTNLSYSNPYHNSYYLKFEIKTKAARQFISWISNIIDHNWLPDPPLI